MAKPVYKRVLLKISGEALAGGKHFGLDFQVIGEVCDAIKEAVAMGVQVGVVVGGGNTAAADALYLSKLCEKVTIIHRRDTLRASKSYLKPLQECKNVTILWDTLPEAILGENAVTGLRVKNKNTGETQDIPCSGIFVAIGNVPNTALFADSVTLDENGYVEADETPRTNIPGVFAVGDVRRKPLRQVVTAVADGAMASHFIESAD